MIDLFIAGIPRPGGSKTAMPHYNPDGSPKTKPTATGKQRPVLNYIDDAAGNKGWREAVGYTVKNWMQHRRLSPMEGPLRLTARFLMPRPKSVTREHHTTKPDVTKLLRSTEDALKGIAWLDDSQIDDQHATKRYAGHGESPGVWLTIQASDL